MAESYLAVECREDAASVEQGADVRIPVLAEEEVYLSTGALAFPVVLLALVAWGLGPFFLCPYPYSLVQPSTWGEAFLDPWGGQEVAYSLGGRDPASLSHP